MAQRAVVLGAMCEFAAHCWAGAELVDLRGEANRLLALLHA